MLLPNAGMTLLHAHLTLSPMFHGVDSRGCWHYQQPASPQQPTLSGALSADVHLLGFALQARSGGHAVTGPKTAVFTPSEWQLTVPHAAIVLLTGSAAFVALRIARANRVRPGHCSRCGYDLRASPERCPECGDAKIMRATSDVAASS